MTDLPDLQAGIYEHYKGDQYLVLGYCDDSTNRGCDCDPGTIIPQQHRAYCASSLQGQIYVAYISLRPLVVGARLNWHIRRADQFHQEVCWRRGCVNWGMWPPGDSCRAHPNSIWPRFKYVRPA